MHPTVRSLIAGLALPLLLGSAAAQEVQLSSFGTLGYAVSDNGLYYQNAINKDGTFSRDSRFGVQAEVPLGSAFSATVQLRWAPAEDNDQGWNLRVPWAFVSWRPDNDWTVRTGKMRMPMLLYSENIDVGSTTPFARLPIEAYSVLPIWDFYGVSVGRELSVGPLDVELTTYAGWAQSHWRVFLRDDLAQVPGALKGPGYEGISGSFLGGIISVRKAEDHYRLSALAWDTQLETLDFGTDYPFVPIAPGIGYYQVSNIMPGPGARMRERVRVYTLGAGIEKTLPADFRLIAEGVLRRSDRALTGAGTNSRGGYIALQRKMGAWTPYIYRAELKSSRRAREIYSRYENNIIPAGIPGADQLNASQRWAADSTILYDQRTWALGTTYTLENGHIIKAEWQRTRSGLATAFIDAPIGSSSGGQRVDVFSLSYNFVF